MFLRRSLKNRLAMRTKVRTVGNMSEDNNAENQCKCYRADCVVCMDQPRNVKQSPACNDCGGRDYCICPKQAEPLPTDAQARKGIPIATGFIDYFPDAIAAIARLSQIGNDQHNAGQPLHWDRSKSGDESDAMMRHFIQRGTVDSDGVLHSAKAAWRALALLQKEIEGAQE